MPPGKAHPPAARSSAVPPGRRRRETRSEKPLVLRAELNGAEGLHRGTRASGGDSLEDAGGVDEDPVRRGADQDDEGLSATGLCHRPEAGREGGKRLPRAPPRASTQLVRIGST